MRKIGVVYFSQTNVTYQLSQALIKGVVEFGGFEVVQHRIEGRDIVEGRYTNLKVIESLHACDAIVFGTPTYMGGVSAQFKAFLDATSELWCEQLWAGKVAAGFTCGSALNGDQGATLQYLITFANQHGMFWVGLDTPSGYTSLPVNRLGCQMGVVAHSDEGIADPCDLTTANYLGNRIAKVTSSLVRHLEPKEEKPIRDL